MIKPILFSLFLQSYLLAVLPPQILKKSAISSSEIIKIKVKNVEIKSKTKYVKLIKAKVKVLEVKKTKSNLTKGDFIIIEYSSRKLKKGMVGPKSNPILYKNQVTAAFLYKKRNKDIVYNIGAHSNSFNDYLYKHIRKSGLILKKKSKLKRINMERKIIDGYTIDEKKNKIFKGKLIDGKGGMPVLYVLISGISEYIIIDPKFVRNKDLKWKDVYKKMYGKDIEVKAKLRIRYCGIIEQCMCDKIFV